MWRKERAKWMKKQKSLKLLSWEVELDFPVLLRGLKQYPVDITAVVTVADDGGSSGRLRDELEYSTSR